VNGLKKREIISIAFVVTLLISNILATKLIQVGTIVLPAAVIIYPFCFMIGDVLTEVWGYRFAKKVIYAGFLANFCLVCFTYLGQLLPPAPYWANQKAYEAIFGMVPRIVVGSFSAYLIGEILNSWSLEKIKTVTGVKLLFIRTIGSSVIGQLFDTCIFITIAFYGIVPNKVLIGMLLAQYITKVLIEALGGTPLAYLLVSWARNENSNKVAIPNTTACGD
jgi:uncharacterized integral membrane protein (TIGR00697 family)